MRKVPDLRFDGFDGEWEEKKLGETFKITMGQSPNSKNYTDDDSYLPLIGGNSDIYKGKINPSVFTTQQTKKSYPGDIIMTVRAPVGDLAKNNSEVVIGRGVCSINGNNYLYYNLEKKKNKNYWGRITSGSTFESINSSDIRNVNLHMPEIEEQEKIGNLFKKIDDLIEIQEVKVTKMEEFKKSMLQKMFPKKSELVPEFRFDGFDDKWTVKKIGEIMNVTSVKRVMQSDWKTYGVPFLRARDLVAFSEGNEVEEKLFISEPLYNEYTQISGKVSKGDLLVTGVGSIGIPYLVENEEPIYFKDGNIIWLVNNKVMDGRFLYYSFFSRDVIKFIKKSSGKGTVGTLTISTAKSIPLVYPSVEEQAKIGQFFKNLDIQIENEEKLLDSYKMMKKSLLQKMFV